MLTCFNDAGQQAPRYYACGRSSQHRRAVFEAPCCPTSTCLSTVAEQGEPPRSGCSGAPPRLLGLTSRGLECCLSPRGRGADKVRAARDAPYMLNLMIHC